MDAATTRQTTPIVPRPIGLAIAMAVLTISCGPSDAEPLPPDSFAFGVFGDGPYRGWEMGRFNRLIGDVNRAELEWFIHVGDILWFPCSETEFRDRLQRMNSVRHPVVYTPGDNEWADCHEAIAGGYLPLDRLEKLREIFFADPSNSLGGQAMALESQGQDSTFSEFVENVRWRRGGFLFATLHLIGAGSTSASFAGRTAADDEAVTRRNAAAIAWLAQAFSIAVADSLTGVILALHGNPQLERPHDGYEEFVEALTLHVRQFTGPVLLIHGDSHTQLVDQPLVDPETGESFPNFTRLETYGSPDIGWVRVVVDTVAGRVLEYQPRRIPWRFLW